MAYLPNPVGSILLSLPSQSSYDVPTMAPASAWLINNFSFNFPIFKMGQIVPRHLAPFLIPMLYSDEKVRPEFQGNFLTSYDLSFAYGFGVEGFRDTTHWPDNAAAFYPHSKTNSKFSEHSELKLPDDYQAFMDKFESVVLIAFGTTFMPSEADMMRIFEAVKLADPTKMGFIIGLKEKLTSFAKIKEANLPNVFLSKWVP